MKSVTVQIHGQAYVLKGEAEEDYLRRVAEYVDQQMQAVSHKMKTSTPTKVAVLTAINIAHQLFQAEQKLAQEEADLEQRALDLMETIEQQLQS